MSEQAFPEGIRIDPPRERAPDFVKGRIGIEVDKFIDWLKENKNDKGWVNLDLKESKKGGLYVSLNDYKPKTAEPDDDISPSDFPF